VVANCDQFAGLRPDALQPRTGLGPAHFPGRRDGLSLPADTPAAPQPRRPYVSQRAEHVGTVGVCREPRHEGLAIEGRRRESDAVWRPSTFDLRPLVCPAVHPLHTLINHFGDPLMAIEFGIIGCGMISRFHAKAVADIKGAKVTACFDSFT